MAELDSWISVTCRVRPQPPSCARAVDVVRDMVEVTVSDAGLEAPSYLPACTHTCRGSRVAQFQFDRVLPETTSQEAVYREAAKHIVDDVLNGFNGTVFCYGQTGSGKTYTMVGDLNHRDRRGILPRAAEHIFQAARSLTGLKVKVSSLEIGPKNIVQDLLPHPDQRPAERGPVVIREFTGQGPCVLNVEQYDVTNYDELLELAQEASLRRLSAATQKNNHSSRSHSIFTIKVTHSVDHQESSGTLHLVDLAGSERQKSSQAEGQRLEEARTINKSLSALSKVISALTDEQQPHVPYRDSKLTWMLREALGGNARTSLVLAVSPAMGDRQETLSTLKFGTRAKEIKNSPTANLQPVTRSVDFYKDKLARQEIEIRRLKDELRSLKSMTPQQWSKPTTQCPTDSSNSSARSSGAASVELEAGAFRLDSVPVVTVEEQKKDRCLEDHLRASSNLSYREVQDFMRRHAWLRQNAEYINQLICQYTLNVQDNPRWEPRAVIGVDMRPELKVVLIDKNGEMEEDRTMDEAQFLETCCEAADEESGRFARAG